MRLSHRQFDLLQRAILELYDYRELKAFRQAFPGIFLQVFPVDYFLYNKFEFPSGPPSALLLDFVESEPRMDQAVSKALPRQVMRHPFTIYFLGSGDPTALKTSDFMSSREYQRTVFHQEAQRPLGVNFTMSIGLGGTPGTAAALNLGARRDFTEQDRLLLNLIRPHFDRAHRNAQRVSDRRASGTRCLSEFDLSPRETQVAQWLGQGKTNPEIAIILQANVRTIEKHVAKIIDKLRAENRTTAALMVANSDREV